MSIRVFYAVVALAIAGVAPALADVPQRGGGPSAWNASHALPAADLVLARLNLSIDDETARVHVANLQPSPVVPPVAAPRVAPDYNVFGSVIVPVGAIPASRRWREVWSTDVTARFGALCPEDVCSDGVSGTLARAARRAAGLGQMAALELVNDSVNRAIRYRAETGDEWASPVVSAQRGWGDCEDYAIAKYWMLRSIGVADAQMQMIMLKDTRRGLYHAVLAVHVDGDRFILDSLRNRVVRESDLRDYVPLVSFVGERSFVHGVDAGRTDVATARN